MQINEIKKIIQKEVEKRGYICEERKSISTDSWYFSISKPDHSVKLLFRVANHKATKGVKTLRIDHKINQEVVERFVINCCKDLSRRVIKNLLGM